MAGYFHTSKGFACTAGSGNWHGHSSGIKGTRNQVAQPQQRLTLEAGMRKAGSTASGTVVTSPSELSWERRVGGRGWSRGPGCACNAQMLPVAHLMQCRLCEACSPCSPAQSATLAAGAHASQQHH